MFYRLIAIPLLTHPYVSELTSRKIISSTIQHAVVTTKAPIREEVYTGSPYGPHESFDFRLAFVSAYLLFSSRLPTLGNDDARMIAMPVQFISCGVYWEYTIEWT